MEGELLRRDISVGLNEQNSLGGALDHQLSGGGFPQPAGVGVVENQGLGDGVADDFDRILSLHGSGAGGASLIDCYGRNLNPEEIVVVNVREGFEFMVCGRRWSYQFWSFAFSL